METIITTAIAMTIGITEIIKRTNIIADIYVPVIALFIGIATTVLAMQSFTIEGITTGIIVGLSASGLWSGGKHIASNINK